MTFMARDDLAKIEFKIWPRLAYGPRMALAAGTVAVGILIQLQAPMVALIFGSILVFGGILVTLVNSKTNEPPKLAGERTWERVTPEEFARVRVLVERGKRWARRDAFGAGNLVGCGVFLLLAAAVVGGWVAMSALADRRAALVWIIDGGMFLVLTFFAGTRKAWTPGDFLIKIDALEAVLKAQTTRPLPRIAYQPMLEVLKDTKTGQLPKDARLLATIAGAPEDLIGFQVQCSINKVQNASYPYVYAVIIARKAFDLSARLANAVVAAQDLLTLERKDREVDVAVIRQKTTKTSGYHTKPADQARIVQETAVLTLWLAGPPVARK